MADDKVIQGIENLPPHRRGWVATVGNFDGVHVGHGRIIEAAAGRAAEVRAGVLALTFDPLPEAVLAPDRPVELIAPIDVRCRLLAECGADRVVVVAPTAEFLRLSADQFIRKVLVERLGAGCVVEGPDFRFGRGRAGDLAVLRRLAAEGGFEVVEVEPVQLDLPGAGSTRISSSLIRQLIRSGDVASARRCLGRPFTLYGRIVPGVRRGRSLGFPTANVEAPGLALPGDGIYAAWAEAGGKKFPAAVSIGDRPTFGPGARAIEAHLIGAAGEFYGRDISLTFLARLRDQRKFPDAESLRAEIAKDVQRVREICP